jgi:type VI secretion system protein ImpA
MAIELEYDLEALLAPLGDGSDSLGTPPSEDDFSSSIVQLRYHCRDALKAERQRKDMRRIEGSDGGGDDPQVHWRAAASTAASILARQWKDLGVAAMLTQALARTHGSAGIAFGYQVAGGLVSRFWPEMLQRWNNKVGENFKPIADLSAQLAVPLRQWPITEAGLARWQYDRIGDLEQTADEEERARKVALGMVTRDEFTQSVRNSSAEFYQHLVEDLRACKRAVDAFDDTVVHKLSEIDQLSSAPATSGVLEQVEQLVLLVEEIAAEKLAAASARKSEEEAGRDSHEATAKPAPSNGAIRNRQDAFEQLERIAQFFERTEPQSFLPAEIRWVVRQGRLSPQEFFAEMLKSEEGRRYMSRIVGVKEDEE